MTNKNDLNVLIQAVNILQNECLSKKDTEMKILKYENKTIKPRPNGKGYFTRYRDANGQHSIYGSTAEEVLQKLKTALKNAPKKRSADKTIGWWWFEWLKFWKQDIRPGTLRTYQSVYNCYIKNIENLELNQLTVFNLGEFLQSIKYSRQRTRTFNYLKSCLDKAFKLKLIEQNPLELLPKPKHEKKHVKAMTQEEQNRFVSVVSKYNNKFADLCLVMIQQGFRLGEVLGLTIDNLNFFQKTITINKTFSHSVLGEPKTKTSCRTVPMFGTVSDILIKYAGTKQNQRIFNFSEKCATLKFYDFLKQAGLSGFTTHSLRSTFATRLYEAGVPSLQIRDWLGHSDVATTEQIYIKVLKESSLKWVNIANLMLKCDTQIDTQINKIL